MRENRSIMASVDVEIGLGFRREESKLREGRKKGRRRRKEMERSFETFVVYSNDCMDDASLCSFDHDDEILLALAGRECNHGPVSDPDQNKRSTLSSSSSSSSSSSLPYSATLTSQIHTNPISKTQKEQQELLSQQENRDPSKNCFPNTPRESNNRRYNYEAPQFSSRTLARQRPASLDLNCHVTADVAGTSPAFYINGMGVMGKKQGTVTSPGPSIPGYTQPGWSSERVPLGSQRYRNNRLGLGLGLPFNNGRTLPSKWEDAERWIFSPVSGSGVHGTPGQQFNRRRVKSKSGPLGSPSRVSEVYVSASPTAQILSSGKGGGSFTRNSALLAGVLMSESGPGNSQPRPYSAAIGVRGWLDTPAGSASSVASSRGSIQDERIEIRRKDVGTQTSPTRSAHSSPKLSPLFAEAVGEQLESHFAEVEIENTKAVNDRVTVTKWSKKHVVRGSDRCLTKVTEWKRRTVQVNQSARCISKIEKEEAKISAWENMQKAKAEAAIQKLVMKLERKRSSSMDKILNKLNFAQKRAQEMRSQASSSQTQNIGKQTAKKVVGPHLYKNGQISSFSGCFHCHAF